jgi:hypothetical protein
MGDDARRLRRACRALGDAIESVVAAVIEPRGRDRIDDTDACHQDFEALVSIGRSRKALRCVNGGLTKCARGEDRLFMRTKTVKLPLGRIVATPAVLERVPNEVLLAALSRHASGDWGDVGVDDWIANDEALQHDDRILSAYRTELGTRFWIITEADRSVTTVLLPEEY